MFPGGCPARRAKPGASPEMPEVADDSKTALGAREREPTITVAAAGGAPGNGAGARARAPQADAIRAAPGRGVPVAPRGPGVHGTRQLTGAGTMRVAALVRAVIRAAGRGAGTTRVLRSRNPGPNGAAGHGRIRTPEPGQTRRRREMTDVQDPGDVRGRTEARDQMGVPARGEAAPGLRVAGERAVADVLWLVAGEQGLAAAPGQQSGRQAAPARDPGYVAALAPRHQAGCGRKAARGRRHAGVRAPGLPGAGLVGPGIPGRVGAAPRILPRARAVPVPRAGAVRRALASAQVRRRAPGRTGAVPGMRDRAGAAPGRAGTVLRRSRTA
jgi:hypothetical protein